MRPFQAMREQMQGRDVRVVELPAKPPYMAGNDGHVRIDAACPWCDKTLWMHFGLSGQGSFMCKPCGAIGTAIHGEYLGKRQVELTLEGEVNDLRGHAN